MESSDRGTLESRYDSRVRELLEKDPEEAVQYMLRALPLIQEYIADDPSLDTPDAPAPKSSHLDTFGFKVTATSSRKDVFCRYMAEVEDDYTFYQENRPKKKAAARGQEASSTWICTSCGGRKVFNQTEAMITCSECGLSEQYIEMNQHNLSFDEQINMEVSSHCAYKRVNHFVGDSIPIV